MSLEEVERAIEADEENGEFMLKEVLTHYEEPVELFYEMLRDGRIRSFKLIHSLGVYSPKNIFTHCCNALQQLSAKNIFIPEEIHLHVLLWLSLYGFRNLRGDSSSIKPKDHLIQSTQCVIQWIDELKKRTNCDSYLGIDNYVLWRIRMIHNHLFFIKNNLTKDKRDSIAAVTFCLAIFIKISENSSDSFAYKCVLNKRNVMQFLDVIKVLLDKQERTPKFHQSKRKLHKVHHVLKLINSLMKILRYSEVSNEVANDDDPALRIAAIKRFHQILGEISKNTNQSPNFPNKLHKLLPPIFMDHFKINSNYRDDLSHGYRFTQMYIRDADELSYYLSLIDYIEWIVVSMNVLFLYIFCECVRHAYGTMRRCHSLEELREFVRYVGDNRRVQFIEKSLQQIKAFLQRRQKHLAEDEAAHEHMERKQQFDKDFSILKENCMRKTELIENLEKWHLANNLDTLEIIAFSDRDLKYIHCLLENKLQKSCTRQLLKMIPCCWNVQTTTNLINSEYSTTQVQSFIQNQHKHILENAEKWRWEKKIDSILNYFDSNMDYETFSTLKQRLRDRLENSKKGYFDDVFKLDRKIKIIQDVLKSQGFKDFDMKLNDLRQLDADELNNVFRQFTIKIRNTFQRYNCDSIESFIPQHRAIPSHAILAIEFWQVQAMEALISSHYFEDNFNCFRKFIPIIWGKSYRNSLAHDSISYNLLINSSPLNTLINGFVLGWNWNIDVDDIFSYPPKLQMDGLMDAESTGSELIQLQEDLICGLEHNNMDEVNRCVKKGAEFSGRCFRSLGKLSNIKNFSITEILAHGKFEPSSGTLDQHKFSILGSDISQAVKLNSLSFHEISNMAEALTQFKQLIPYLITPCIGSVIQHYKNADKMTAIEKLLGQCSLYKLYATEMKSNYSDISRPTDRFKAMLQNLEENPSIRQNLLSSAIDEQDWPVVKNLLGKRTDPWISDETCFQKMLEDGQDKLFRRTFLQSKLNSSQSKNVYQWVAKFGSIKLLKFLMRNGFNIWHNGHVLSAALQNKNLTEYFTDKFFKPIPLEQTCVLSLWKKLLKEFKILVFLETGLDFMLKIARSNFKLFERLFHVVTGFFKSTNNTYASEFRFKGPSTMGRDNCDILLEQITTIQKTNMKINQIENTLTVFSQNDEKLDARLHLTIYSKQPLGISEKDFSVLTCDENHSSRADAISSCLRNQLMKHQNLVAVIAEVTLNEGSSEYQFIYIAPNSCIFQQIPNPRSHLGNLLNFENQGSILHHLVTKAISEDLLKQLIKFGADPACLDSLGTSGLATMVYSMSIPLTLFLYFYENAENKHINGTHIFNHRNQYGDTVLSAAVMAGNCPVVEYLLQNGADPLEATSIANVTVLGHAIMRRDDHMVELLLGFCPVLIHAKSDYSPLLSAVAYNCEKVVRILLERGCDLTEDVVRQAQKLGCNESWQIIIEHKSHLLGNDV